MEETKTSEPTMEEFVEFVCCCSPNESAQNIEWKIYTIERHFKIKHSLHLGTYPRGIMRFKNLPKINHVEIRDMINSCLSKKNRDV